MDSTAHQDSEMQSDRPEDRVAIQDLVLSYAEGVDRRDPASVGSLFSEDAIFRAYDRPKGEARGPIEIQALMSKLTGSFSATLHHVSAVHLKFVSPDAATGVTSLHAWHQFTTERPDAILWGRYYDEFVKSPDGWKFASRTLRVAGHQDFEFPWIPAL